MTVLVAEPLAEAAVALLKSQPGWNVIVSSPKEYSNHLAEADALIVRSAVQVGGRALRMPEGHSSAVRGVAVTPDGRRAVSASWDHTLKVWDLATGRALCTLEGHSDSVNGVAVTPDGQRAVSASWDRTLKVWDLASGRALRTLEGHSSAGVAVTPDGQLAVSAEDHTLKVWDLASGRELRTLKGH